MTHEKQTLSVKDFFDSRAESYHRVSRWAADEKLNSKTDEFLCGLSGRVALDLGAGTGTLISRISGFQTKIALDISPKMLSQIEDPSIHKIVGDVHCLQLPDDYADLIVCRQVLHYCDLTVAFQNIMRVLSREGWLHIVQVVDLDNVSESWDQEWARFRNVGDRRHQRRFELEKCYFENFLRVIKSEYLKLRDEYSWGDFFVKNNVDKEREREVKNFFQMTPKEIVEQIDLQIDSDRIAYNRVFGFWLLQRL